MAETTSKTVRDTTLVERLVGSHHYKTTISDGKIRAVGLGRNREVAERRASDLWNRAKK